MARAPIGKHGRDHRLPGTFGEDDPGGHDPVPAPPGFVVVTDGYSGFVRAFTSLVAYWPLNQDDPDASGSFLPDLSNVGLPADLSVAVAGAAWTTGEGGFPNVAGGVSVKNAATNAVSGDAGAEILTTSGTKLAVDSTGLNSFTVTAWVKALGDTAASANGATCGPIVGQFDADNTRMRADGFLTPGGNGWMLMQSNASQGNGPDQIGTFNGCPIFFIGGDEVFPVHGSSPVALSTTDWTFIAVTVTATEITMYLNGVQVASKTRTSTADSAPTSPNSVFVAGTTVEDLGGTSHRRGFKGNMNAVALFNDALTSGQIAALYKMNVAPGHNVLVQIAPTDGSTLGDHSVDPNKLTAGPSGSELTTDGTRVYWGTPKKSMAAEWAFDSFTATGPGPSYYVPYAADGSVLTFDLSRIRLRAETPASSSTITVQIEKSAGGDAAFSASSIGSVSLAPGHYEADTTSSLGTVQSGQYVRCNFTAVSSTARKLSVVMEGTSAT